MLSQGTDDQIVLQRDDHRPYRNIVIGEWEVEYEHGHYLITPEKPDIISAWEAIHTKNDNIHLVHNYCRPSGNWLNDFAINNKFQYQSLQDAIDYIRQGDCLAKIGLAQAYSVKLTVSLKLIHPIIKPQD